MLFLELCNFWGRNNPTAINSYLRFENMTGYDIVSPFRILFCAKIFRSQKQFWQLKQSLVFLCVMLVGLI